MQIQRLLKRIARVESLPCQLWWAEHGDANNHVLLDELIDTTAHAAKHHTNRSDSFESLTDDEQQALIEFHDIVDNLFTHIPWDDASISTIELIQNNPSLERIRQSAAKCLRCFDTQFSLDDLIND